MRSIAVAAILFTTVAVSQPATTPLNATDVGYAVGHDVGRATLEQLRADNVAVDAAQLAAGFQDAVLERDARMDEASRRQVLRLVERDRSRRLAERRMAEDPVFAAVVEANLERSRAFHAAFGRQPDVVTLPGGTQYRVTRAGTGPVPGPDATVVASFQLRTLDGMVTGEEQREEFRVAYLFPGAAAIFTRMPVGSTWEVAIPPSQGLGLAGDPPMVGPNETVLATVTLHEVR